jgi:pyruvyl transferase EpsO
MSSLKAKLDAILGSFDTSRRVVFFDYPLHLNVGDLLINLGTEQFLADHNIHVWRRYSVCDMPASIRGMEDDVVILCHGGGNLGDLWPHSQKGRERVLELYPRNRVVVLPQTVYFESQDRFRQSVERFRSHGNCHIFARDNRSLEILRRGGIAQASAMPDMAQYLWGSLLPDLPPFYEAQPMRFVRRDKESKASAVLQGGGGTAQTYDWPRIVRLSTYRIARVMLMAIGSQNRVGLRTQKYWQWSPVRDRAIRDGVRFFSRYRKVYTNRLHGMILGLLLNREVCAFDNSYGKLSSYHDTWLEGMECLTWEPEE